MKLPKDLRVRISGIRGFCPEVLTPEIAYALIRGYVGALPEGPVVIARDPRPTGASLKKAVVQALTDEGREILDADFVPLPSIQVYTRQTNAVAGIHITASHNPAEYNGLKCLDEEGSFLSQETLDGIVARTERFLGQPIIYTENTSTNVQRAVIDAHLNLLDDKIQKGKRLTVAVDACNGAGSKIVPELLEKMECDVVHVATDWTKPFPRKPEPMPAHLEWTQQELEGKEYDLCVIVDPDSDRLTLIDEQGTLLSEETTLPIISLGYVAAGATGTIVVNLSTSQMTEKVTEGTGLTVERSAVGEFNVVSKMKETHAILGGEGSGSVIDPTLNFGRDALVGIVHIINYIRSAGKEVSEIVATLPQYEIRKEKLPADTITDREVFYKKVAEAFPGAETNYDDGIRLTWNNEEKWIHIRPSNTEPIFRVIGEAKSEKELGELFKKSEQLVKSLS